MCIRDSPNCVISSEIGIQKLDSALKMLLSKHRPELIIIETSGSCHPLPLVEYFKNHNKLLLTKIFTLVDCLMLAHDYDHAERLIPQMQNNLAQNK